MIPRTSFQKFLTGIAGIGLALTLMMPATPVFAAPGDAPQVAVERIGNRLSNVEEHMLEEYLANQGTEYQRTIIANALDSLPSTTSQAVLEATLVEMGLLPPSTSALD